MLPLVGEETSVAMVSPRRMPSKSIWSLWHNWIVSHSTGVELWRVFVWERVGAYCCLITIHCTYTEHYHLCNKAIDYAHLFLRNTHCKWACPHECVCKDRDGARPRASPGATITAGRKHCFILYHFLWHFITLSQSSRNIVLTLFLLSIVCVSWRCLLNWMP